MTAKGQLPALDTEHTAKCASLAKARNSGQLITQSAADRVSSGEPNLLEAVVRLFGSDADACPYIFLYQRKMDGFVRLKQITYGVTRFFLMKLRRQPVVVLHSEKLAYLRGWATLSFAPSAMTVLASLKRLQPIIPIPTSEQGVTGAFASLDIDRTSELQMFFSTNGYVLVRAQRHGKPCIVHYGPSHGGSEAIIRHANGLMLANKCLSAVLDDLLPDVCARHSYGTTEVVVQSEVRGKIPCVNLLDDRQTARMIEAGFVPLRKIYTALGTGRPFDDRFVEQELKRLVAVLPEYEEHLTPALTCILDWIVKSAPETIPSHGDYAPRNILFDVDCLNVMGIVDWEWFWEEGIAGFDALKFLLEIHAQRSGKTFIEMLAQFLGDHECIASSLMQPIMELYELSPLDLWHIAIIIWLRVLWMGCVITAPASKQWLDDAVLVPARAIELKLNATL